ncbi:hypothetical protein JOQ06_017283, partial [Pogonophryne albipinna]
PKLDMTPISSWSRGGPRLSHSAQTQGGWKAGREKELKDCEGGGEKRQDISLKALLGAKGPAQLSLKPNQPE